MRTDTEKLREEPGEIGGVNVKVIYIRPGVDGEFGRVDMLTKGIARLRLKAAETLKLVRGDDIHLSTVPRSAIAPTATRRSAVRDQRVSSQDVVDIQNNELIPVLAVWVSYEANHEWQTWSTFVYTGSDQRCEHYPNYELMQTQRQPCRRGNATSHSERLAVRLDIPFRRAAR